MSTPKSEIEGTEPSIVTNQIKDDEPLAFPVPPQASKPLRTDNLISGGTTVVVGTTQNIQQAIDAMSNAGGGTVFIKNGIHIVNNDLVIPSDVKLMGESFTNVIINFNGGAHSIKVHGTDAYNTGTVSATNGSTTVTGLGTTWSSNLTTSHKIVIDEWVYGISSVDNDTQITLTTPFGGKTAAGQLYQAAVFVDNVFIQNIYVTGSTTDGISMQYTDLCFLEDNISAANGGKGLNGLHFHRGLIDTFVSQSNTDDGVYVESAYVSWFNWLAAFGNGSEGLRFKDCSNSIIDNGLSNDNTAMGVFIEYTDRALIGRLSINSGASIGLLMGVCENCTVHALVSRNNADDGINVNCSSSNSFQSVTSDGNAGDGIEFDNDSDNNRVFGGAYINNGAFGVNIDSPNCDKNIIVGNDLSGNTSGDIDDSGSDTVSADNIS